MRQSGEKEQICYYMGFYNIAARVIIAAQSRYSRSPPVIKAADPNHIEFLERNIDSRGCNRSYAHEDSP